MGLSTKNYHNEDEQFIRFHWIYINLIISTSQTGGLDSKPNKKKFTGDARYKGGNVEVVVTMADGKTDKKSYPADLVKNHPNNYEKNE